MATIPASVGPVVDPVQLVIRAEPLSIQVIAPLGATAPVDPVTRAVNISVPPKVGDPEALRATEGIAGATMVVVVDAVAATLR